MPSNARFAEVAALAGDPARAAMLHALMDGRALTATELSRAAGISPQTTSGHLARLTAAGLLSVTTQGRHRYHRLANASVARMMESIMQVAAVATPLRPRLFVGPRDAALRRARTCYDHFAGTLGVALADALGGRGLVELTLDAGMVTEAGVDFFCHIGLDPAAIKSQSTRGSGRVLCRPCLDWSERRPHLAGAIATALCTHSMEHGWTRRMSGSRAVEITPAGAHVFRETFGAAVP